MLNMHRREYILGRISSSNRISVIELVEGLNVSGETVRRDLMELEREGLLRRIHGGAVGLTHNRDIPFQERARKNIKEKVELAKLAKGLISDNSSIFLDTGSTNELLARQLGQFSDLKLYTNSLRVAQSARDHFGVSIFLTPGKLRKVELDLVGNDTIHFIQNYIFDTVFMGTGGIDIDRGFMDFEEEESWIRRALLANARRRAIVADSSKFGKPANTQTAHFEDIDLLITDKVPPKSFLDSLSGLSLEIIHG